MIDCEEQATNGKSGWTGWSVSTSGVFWWVLFWLCAILFFGLALSSAVYEVTTPEWSSLRVLVRKLYSIVAFVVLGYMLTKAQSARDRQVPAVRAALLIALYSGAIEIAQVAAGSREGLTSQTADVSLGLAGGLAGALLAGRHR